MFSGGQYVRGSSAAANMVNATIGADYCPAEAHRNEPFCQQVCSNVQENVCVVDPNNPPQLPSFAELPEALRNSMSDSDHIVGLGFTSAQVAEVYNAVRDGREPPSITARTTSSPSDRRAPSREDLARPAGRSARAEEHAGHEHRETGEAHETTQTPGMPSGGLFGRAGLVLGSGIASDNGNEAFSSDYPISGGIGSTQTNFGLDAEGGYAFRRGTAMYRVGLGAEVLIPQEQRDSLGNRYTADLIYQAWLAGELGWLFKAGSNWAEAGPNVRLGYSQSGDIISEGGIPTNLDYPFVSIGGHAALRLSGVEVGVQILFTPDIVAGFGSSRDKEFDQTYRSSVNMFSGVVYVGF